MIVYSTLDISGGILPNDSENSRMLFGCFRLYRTKCIQNETNGNDDRFRRWFTLGYQEILAKSGHPRMLVPYVTRRTSKILQAWSEQDQKKQEERQNDPKNADEYSAASS